MHHVRNPRTHHLPIESGAVWRKGWSDDHLHKFRIHGKRDGVAQIGGISFSDDPDAIRLNDFRFQINERFIYEYDFKDGWQHQIRVEGKVEKISDQESDEYFASRPRLSQVGAWVSQQSQVLESRALLVKKAAEFAASREGRNIKRPGHWGGLRLDPDRVEFWYGKKYRLHDRFCYQAEDGNWVKTRLYP